MIRQEPQNCGRIILAAITFGPLLRMQKSKAGSGARPPSFWIVFSSRPARPDCVKISKADSWLIILEVELFLAPTTYRLIMTRIARRSLFLYWAKRGLFRTTGDEIDAVRRWELTSGNYFWAAAPYADSYAERSAIRCVFHLRVTKRNSK